MFWYKLLDVIVLGCFEFVLGALKYHPAIFHDHKDSARRIGTVSPLRPVTGCWLQVSAAAIVAKVGHQLPVLITLRDDEIGGVLGIALLDDERHDGIGGDGI